MNGDAGSMTSVVEVIVERMARIERPERRTIVAVDGIGASGKTTLAAQLAERFSGSSRSAAVIHVDDFFHPRPIRHARGRLSAEGFWLDTYNYDALLTTALRPLQTAGEVAYCDRSLDTDTDQIITPQPRRAAANAVVIVEGTFLHRAELAGFWDFSVFLDIPFALSGERLVRRNRLSAEAAPGLLGRYAGAQMLYFRSARPWEKADLIIDSSDVTSAELIEPARSFASRAVDEEDDA